MSIESLTASTYGTPFGDLAVFVTPEDGVVRASGFRPLPEIAERLSCTVARRGWELGDLAHIDAVVQAWLAGDGNALRSVDVEQDGGPFFQEVWTAMREVPSGKTISYQELAATAGRPRAMRAAGTACARNNVAPFIPCHRVVKSGGELGSYGFGGVVVKAAMLDLEARADAIQWLPAVTVTTR